MRLTLRTLLAYLDEILEPADAEEMAEKITNSEYAQELVQRTRDVTSRMRLGAPPLTGEGMGLDANTVAEYLDSTLPAEQVPDFEKICLESDSHLAEATASHQILTLVLGEPAEVDDALRRKLCALLGGVQAAESQAEPPVEAVRLSEPEVVAATSAVPLVAEPTPVPSDTRTRRKPEVPDYLREAAQARTRKVMFTLTLAGTAAVLLFLVFTPGNPVHTWLYGDDVAVAKLSGQTPPIKTPTAPVEKTPAGRSDSLRRKTTPAGTLIKQPGGVKPDPSAGNPSDGNPSDGNKVQLPPFNPSRKITPVPAKVTAPEPKNNDQLAKVDPKIDVKRPAVASATGRIGQVVRDKQVLLGHSSAEAPWKRLAPEAVVRIGDELLALPVFRPTVALDAGVTLKLGGGTMVRFLSPPSPGVPVLEIVYGRLLIVKVGKDDTPIVLRMGDHQQRVTVVGTAGLAIKVRRPLSLGKDPATTATPPEIDIFVTHGKVDWQEASGAVKQLQAPHHIPLAGRPRDPITQIDKFPAWIISETVSPIDQRAAKDRIEPELKVDLKVDGSIVRSLTELAKHRQREVRALAVRSLGFVGEFNHYIDALGSVDEKNVWASHFKSLQEAVARDRQSAAKVRSALDRRYPGEADKLARMLWGYSAEGLRDGDAKTLVSYLDHEELIYRVLSSTALKSITGLGLYYQPEETKAKRGPKVRHWQERMKKGEIVPKGMSRKSAKP